MLKRLSQWLVVVPLVLVTGGHWALLQTVAWVSMAARYSQDSRLEVALVKTFDGQHPCELCKLVQKGKSEEQKQDLLRADIKLDLFLTRIPSLLYPPPPFSFPTLELDWPPTRAESPPTPPPRVA
jgi:hypothetical protein